jgi:hypothetical protein
MHVFSDGQSRFSSHRAFVLPPSPSLRRGRPSSNPARGLMEWLSGGMHAKRQTPNAERRTPNAKRQTPNAFYCFPGYSFTKSRLLDSSNAVNTGLAPGSEAGCMGHDPSVAKVRSHSA